MNMLERIYLQKQREVSALKAHVTQQTHQPLALLLRDQYTPTPGKNFAAALRQDKLAVIAEIKRQSPSKGKLAQIENPSALAQQYCLGGAAAISVLTDEVFFAGSLQDLTAVAESLHAAPQPILRKDFIIDPIQIAEAVLAKADAILLIVALLGDKTAELLAYAKQLGIAALVEVHNSSELEVALHSDAEIIGINNRNLNTFTVDPALSLQLLESIPKHIIRVAESGITTPTSAQTYYQAGFDAVLIGEALVQSAGPAHFIEACQYD